MSKVVWQSSPEQFRYTLQYLDADGSWVDDGSGDNFESLKDDGLFDVHTLGRRVRIINNYPEEPIRLVE